MMQYYVPPLAKLIEQFERLPGIGRKTAQRLAFHVIADTAENASVFAKAIVDAKAALVYCEECQNLSDRAICPICMSADRDKSLVCVVEEPKDVVAIERTGEYRGVYHVLHGVISPMDGIGPDEIRIKELLARIGHGMEEAIMATNPDVEGEATGMYISKLLKPLGVKVTRLAYGIPIGGELEFADEITLGRALERRGEI